MKNRILEFCDVYEQGGDTNTLLESLDDTINKIVRSGFKRFCGSVDADDIAQEVRIHLWEDIFEHPEIDYLKDMDAVAAYKYLTTAIKTWAWRTIERSKIENVPSSYKDEDVNIPLFITLSIFNIEYINFPSQARIEDYIESLRYNCSDIINGETVLNYIAPKNDEESEYSVSETSSKTPYAGLSSRTFYKAMKLLKIRAKELL